MLTVLESLSSVEGKLDDLQVYVILAVHKHPPCIHAYIHTCVIMCVCCMYVCMYVCMCAFFIRTLAELLIRYKKQR